MAENKRWACIKGGKVETVVLWDGSENWSSAENYTMVQLPDESPVGPDWDYADGNFVDNRTVEEEN